MAPGRVLLGQAPHQVADLACDRRVSGLVGIGPFRGDQAAVPSQQCGWGDEPMGTQGAGQELGQGREDRAIWPAGSRSVDLAA